MDFDIGGMEYPIEEAASQTILEFLPKAFAVLLRYVDEAKEDGMSCIERIKLLTAGIVILF